MPSLRDRAACERTLSRRAAMAGRDSVARDPDNKRVRTMNQSPEVLTPARKLASQGRTPFPGESDAYREAREALLAEEIEFRRHMTRLSEQRRSLPPGPVIQKRYRFRDERDFEIGLVDLFGDKDALVTYSGCMVHSANDHVRCAPIGWGR